ncbi:hypothetical protein R3P38DRAFT_2794145 [Favolaschia claudopus]|uniref:Uncharacterized protein n=1 Tax=Favolaschia claudopus TaxID=2862362 RepID=A0AAW0AB95_9AGAR
MRVNRLVIDSKTGETRYQFSGMPAPSARASDMMQLQLLQVMTRTEPNLALTRSIHNALFSHATRFLEAETKEWPDLDKGPRVEFGGIRFEGNGERGERHGLSGSISAIWFFEWSLVVVFEDWKLSERMNRAGRCRANCPCFLNLNGTRWPENVDTVSLQLDPSFLYLRYDTDHFTALARDELTLPDEAGLGHSESRIGQFCEFEHAVVAIHVLQFLLGE